MAALAAALLLGCAEPAAQTQATLPSATAVPGAIPVGIVWWPADPADGAHAFVSDVEKCLTARIREIAPEILVVPQHEIRDALYPLFEPATQPATEAAFAAVLARDDVHARLARRGLRHLIAFAGGTREAEPGGFILCGAGYGAAGCFGFMWRGETTALDAALWSLDEAASVRREAAKVEGTSVMPAFVLPIPIPARTKADACRELGTRIATAIRQLDAERAKTR